MPRILVNLLGSVRCTAGSQIVPPAGGAVSRQIQALERSLGLPLFRRKHRGIKLTERGRMLSRTMSDALGRIAETVETITERGPSAELVIASTVAFSHFWLLPRISDFRRAYPDVRLKGGSAARSLAP